MKKSGLLLAMAALSAVPAIAETTGPTLYGSVRIYASSGDATDTDISSDSSRFGVKGSLDTALEGVKALYHVEAFIAHDNGTDTSKTQNEGTLGLDGRLAYVGLTGDFGTVTAGQQWTPFYTMVTAVTDPTINSTAETQDYLRVDSSVAYASPVMNGLQLAAVAVSDKDAAATTPSNEDTDIMQFAAKYSVGSATIAAGVSRAAVQSTPDILALSATYTIDQLTLAAMAQNKKTDLADAEAVTPFELAAVWKVSSVYTLVATHYNKDNATDDNGYNLEVLRSLGKGTTLYANAESDTIADEDYLNYGVGLKVDF